MSNRPMGIQSWRPRLARGFLLACLSVVGCVIAAAGMVFSEIESAYPALTRLMIAAMTGVVLAPLVIATMWHKPIVPAVMAIFLPPTVAGLICMTEFEPDYGYLKLAVPLIFVGCLVTALVVPGVPRKRDPNVCVACRYDLRGSNSLRCSECGWSRAQPPPPRHIARGQELHTAIWLAAAAICGLAIWMVFSWLMSLG